MAKSLSEREFRQEAESALRRIFRTEDPFDAPVAPAVARRALLFPVNYALTEQSDALRAAIRVAGDESLYLSMLGRQPESEHWRYEDPFHLRLDLSELAPPRFQELWPAGSEFALYSPRGAWGVMLGEDGLLVAAGGDAFIRALLAAQEVDPRQQVRDFIAMWQDNKKKLGSDIAWLRPLLANIFPGEADRLLAESSDL